MTRRYPESRTEDAIEVLSDVMFPDPYRWLEVNSAEVRQWQRARSEEHTSELQSQSNLVCRLLLEKKKSHRHDHSVRLQAPLKHVGRRLVVFDGYHAVRRCVRAACVPYRLHFLFVFFVPSFSHTSL